MSDIDDTDTNTPTTPEAVVEDPVIETASDAAAAAPLSTDDVPVVEETIEDGPKVDTTEGTSTPSSDAPTDSPEVAGESASADDGNPSVSLPPDHVESSEPAVADQEASPVTLAAAGSTETEDESTLVVSPDEESAKPDADAPPSDLATVSPTDPPPSSVETAPTDISAPPANEAAPLTDGGDESNPTPGIAGDADD